MIRCAIAQHVVIGTAGAIVFLCSAIRLPRLIIQMRRTRFWPMPSQSIFGLPGATK